MILPDYFEHIMFVVWVGVHERKCWVFNVSFVSIQISLDYKIDLFRVPLIHEVVNLYFTIKISDLM